MLDCDELRRLSSGFLYDAVPDEHKEAVDQHLGKCPVCSFLIKQMSVLRDKLRCLICSDCCPEEFKENLTDSIGKS